MLDNSVCHLFISSQQHTSALILQLHLLHNHTTFLHRQEFLIKPLSKSILITFGC